MNNYRQLKEVLNNIFELNKADLDFGIYRIMNQKRKQVNEFIDKQLPEDIKKALSETQSSDKAEIESELKTLKKTLEDAGIVAEDSPKYKILKERLQGIENADVLEQEVFSHLANFFRRYYKDGDFISMRRYKKDVYTIPYEGEEVKLHWANHDQYYIKSSENFKNYSFNTPDGKKVTFQLKEVSTEQNNNKAQDDVERRFVIYSELPVEEIEGELYINFIYEPVTKATKQETLLNEAFELLSERVPGSHSTVFTLSPTPAEKNSKRTLLEKHLNDYVSKNSFDYFIHKDLGGFLSRELDFYIKNEVLYLDDINTKQTDFFVAQLSKVKAIKIVAQKVIDFLAQIENFQKKLWLKKKLVICTNYCITLDKIPSSYYPEIMQNKAQLAEWKALFDVEIQNAEQLVFEPFLVLDTKFIEESFKDRLLAEFDDLDEQTNGLMINSENFQALNLMQEKYQNKIDITYIDPPYNTGDDFNYKDDFRSSSWLSMLYDRVDLSRILISNSGLFYCSIGNDENYNLNQILNQLFFPSNKIDNISRVAKSASDQGTFFAPSLDFIQVYAKDKNEVPEFRGEVDESLYTKVEVEGEYIGMKYRDDVAFYQSSQKDLRPNQRYFIKCPDGSFVIPPGKTLADEPYDAMLVVQNKGDKRWRWSNDTYLKNKHLLVFKETKTSPLINQIGEQSKYNIYTKSYLQERVEKGTKPRNFIDDIFNRKGADLIKHFSIEFPYSKPIELLQYFIKLSGIKGVKYVIDYFAGSGTTGHSVINMNRGSKEFDLRYILVEMGTYFNTVTKPRIQKVIYSGNWKDGKPQDKSGISQIVKYQVLESYEDTLNNLYLQTKTELDFSAKGKEEYLLQYMLEMESREHLFNLEMFRKPFDYQLKVTENNELKPTKVDLVETFNYLIGLYVSKVQRIKDIKVVEGVTRTGVKTLVIWRDLETTTHDEVEKLLRRFYDSQRTKEFGQIYINGDHHLENLRSEGDQFKIKLIEETFFKKMFNETEL